MSSYATAKITNPSSALDSFTPMVDLSTLPTTWWDAVDTTDGTKGRVFLAASDIECACDWINFNSATKTGILRFLWYGTLASTGDQYIKLFPPKAANDSYAVDDTYGRYNAYDAYWKLYLPLQSNGNDRTVNQIHITTNVGSVSYGDSTGKFGKATSFDGANKYLHTDTITTLFAFPWTMMVWTNPTSTGSPLSRVPLDVGDPAAYRYYPLVTWTDVTSKTVAAACESATGTPYNEANERPINFDEFNHIVGVYSSSTSKKGVINAVDGTGSTASRATPTNKRLVVGATSRLFSNKFLGLIQDVQLHTVARSNVWITEEYLQTSDNTSFWGTWTFESGGDTTSTGSGNINSISNIEGMGETPNLYDYGFKDIFARGYIGYLVNDFGMQLNPGDLFTWGYQGNLLLDDITGIDAFYSASGNVNTISSITGIGYTTKSGYSNINAISDISGSGISYRYGIGNINSFSSLIGIGDSPANTGYGNINTISNIEGVGYSERYGYSNINVISNITGVGDTPSNTGSGNITTISDVNGVGYVIKYSSGNINAISNIQGIGYSLRSGYGNVNSIAKINGVYYSPPNTGYGTVNVKSNVLGVGKTWKYGYGIINGFLKVTSIGDSPPNTGYGNVNVIVSSIGVGYIPDDVDSNRQFIDNKPIYTKVNDIVGLSNGVFTDQQFWRFHRYFFHYADASSYHTPVNFKYYVRQGVPLDQPGETPFYVYHTGILDPSFNEPFLFENRTGIQLKDEPCFDNQYTTALNTNDTWVNFNASNIFLSNFNSSYYNLGAENIDDVVFTVLKAHTLEYTGTTKITGDFESLGKYVIGDASGGDTSGDSSGFNSYVEYTVIDNIDDVYPPYVKYNHNYPEIYMTYPLKGRTILPTDVVVGKVDNKYKRLFFRFDLPPIGGNIEYAYLLLKSNFVSDENKYVNIKTYTVSTIPWSIQDALDSSGLEIMDNVFTSSKWHLNNRDLGFVDETSYMINAFGFYNVPENTGVTPEDPPELVEEKQQLNNYRSSVEAVRWCYDNDSYNFTMILDCEDVPGVITSYISGEDFIAVGDSTDITYKSFWGMNDTSGPPELLITYAAPIISIDHTSFSRSSYVEGSISSDVFNVTNIGYGTLKPTILENCNWASVRYYDFSGYNPYFDSEEGKTYYSNRNNLQGDLNDSSSIGFEIVYNLSGLEVGEHTATIVVYDEYAEPTMKFVTISVTIFSGSFIEYSPESMNLSTIFRRNLEQQTFNVWDGSINILDTLNYEILENVSWISSISDMTSSSVNISDTKTHTITFDTVSLNPGVYNDTITIVNTDNSSNMEQINITLTVLPSSKHTGTYSTLLF